MTFIKLFDNSGNRDIFVNVNTIISFQKGYNGGTSIEFNMLIDHQFMPYFKQVRETPEEILAKIQEANN